MVLNAVVEAVAEAIIGALDERFPNIPVYTDEIIQGIEKPTFWVKVIFNDRTRTMYEGHTYRVLADVRFFDRSSSNRRIMANNIAQTLERIRLPWGKVWSDRTWVEDVDDVLHVFIDYTVRVVPVIDDPLMMRMKEEIRV
ncbi:MAG: hypothetical protein RBR24_06930 [Candidatus Carbobacillus sp.]|nr:hypothetical protein [Candidatus Carbobacillus sp.]